MTFRTSVKFTRQEIEKFLLFLLEWDNYRGGMLSRVDGVDIRNKLINMRRRKHDT